MKNINFYSTFAVVFCSIMNFESFSKTKILEDDAVSVWVDYNYTGNRQILKPGNYSTNPSSVKSSDYENVQKLKINNGKNDWNKLSSFTVPKGYSVLMYFKPDFTGNSVSFTAETDAIQENHICDSVNDKIESIIVAKN